MTKYTILNVKKLEIVRNVKETIQLLVEEGPTSENIKNSQSQSYERHAV